MSVETTFHVSTRQKITRHADVIVEELPGHGESFLSRDIPDEDFIEDAWQELKRSAAIDVVGTERTEGDVRQVYEVPRSVHEVAEETIEHRDPFLPCGHRGLENRGGDLMCRYDGCSQRYDREDVERGGCDE